MRYHYAPLNVFQCFSSPFLPLSSYYNFPILKFLFPFYTPYVLGPPSSFQTPIFLFAFSWSLFKYESQVIQTWKTKVECSL